MMTTIKRAPAVKVEHGFVIVKSDGRGWDKFLYCRKDVAEQVARDCGTGLRVCPARKVFSLRQVTLRPGEEHREALSQMVRALALQAQGTVAGAVEGDSGAGTDRAG